MTDEHLTDAEAPLMVTINSKDATRHKHEMHIRGKMVISLAEMLAAVTTWSRSECIRIARESSEGKP